jgi:hypothetical protein
MTYEGMPPGDQCPGCGDCRGKCGCTPERMRALLERDRAALSDRIAKIDMHSNAVVGLARDLLARVIDGGYERGE